MPDTLSLTTTRAAMPTKEHNDMHVLQFIIAASLILSAILWAVSRYDKV